MRSCLIVLLSVLCISPAGAQPQIRPIQIGERFSGEVKAEFIQHPVRLMQNPGTELYILDFWNIWCGPCIEAMSELDSLQQEFGNRIQIILVTSNTREQVENCFRVSKRKKPSLPMIVSDSLLKKYFPHQSVPHQVWLDREATLKYHTFGYNAGFRNIQRELDGTGNDFVQKIESDDSASSGVTLVKAPGIRSVLSARSVARGGGRVSRIIDTVNGLLHFQVVNRPLLHLYQIAWGYESMGLARIRIRAKQPEPFQLPAEHDKWEDWMNSNLYCYDLTLDLTDSALLMKKLQQKLSQVFPYRAYLKTDSLLCLVAERVQDISASSCQPGKESSVDLTSVLRKIGRANMNQYPFLNKVAETAECNIETPSNFIYGDQLKQELLRCGIRLSLEWQPVEVLVIEDR